MIDEVFLDSDVSRQHEGDEAVGEFVFGVEDANHLGFFDHERGSWRNGGRRTDPNRLTGEASFANEIPRAQDGHDRLFAGFIDYGEPYSTFLDVEDTSARIALREDRFFFLEFRDLPGNTRRLEKILRIEQPLGGRFCALWTLWNHGFLTGMVARNNQFTRGRKCVHK